MANYIKDYNQCLKEIVGASNMTQKEIDDARNMLTQLEALVKDLGENHQVIKHPQHTLPLTADQIIDDILFLFNKHPALMARIENAIAIKKLAKKIGYKGPDHLIDATNQDRPTYKPSH